MSSLRRRNIAEKFKEKRPKPRLNRENSWSCAKPRGEQTRKDFGSDFRGVTSINDPTRIKTERFMSALFFNPSISPSPPLFLHTFCSTIFTYLLKRPQETLESSIHFLQYNSQLNPSIFQFSLTLPSSRFALIFHQNIDAPIDFLFPLPFLKFNPRVRVFFFHRSRSFQLNLLLTSVKCFFVYYFLVLHVHRSFSFLQQKLRLEFRSQSMLYIVSRK